MARLRNATATSSGGIVVRYREGEPQLVVGMRRRERDNVTWTLPKGTLFKVSFDLCAGATAPVRNDFRCTVEQASSPQGANLSLTGITCAVTIP